MWPPPALDLLVLKTRKKQVCLRFTKYMTPKSIWEILGTWEILRNICLINSLNVLKGNLDLFRFQAKRMLRYLLIQPQVTASSVQFSCSVVSDSLPPHESQHTRPPCPLPTPRVHPDSRPSSQWCHPAISSSVVPFSSCPQSLPASGSFPMSQLFAWGGQSIGVSALVSVLPVNTQDWSLEWTGWISLQSKGLSRVFSNTTVQKHQFFGT